MTRRSFIALATCAIVIVSSIGVGFTGAFFRDTSVTPQAVSAAVPTTWLHLYSQSTDPQQAGDYAERRHPDPGPAATGADTTLSIDLGRRPPSQGDGNGNSQAPALRSFVIQTPAPLPGGAATVDVAVRIENEGGNATMPFDRPTITQLDGSGIAHTQVPLGPGERRQVNLFPATSGLSPHTAYTSEVLVTLKFPDSSVLHYRVPVTLCTSTPQQTCS